MTNGGLPTLEQMTEQCGKVRMREWKATAQREWEGSSYIGNNNDAYHSFIYEEVYKMFLRYKNKEVSTGK